MWERASRAASLTSYTTVRDATMRQDQLALATGVGRRFVIDLEAGKPSCQLGRSLLVAKALGLDLAILASDACSQSATAPELPDVAEEEEPDGYSIRIL